MSLRVIRCDGLDNLANCRLEDERDTFSVTFALSRAKKG